MKKIFIPILLLCGVIMLSCTDQNISKDQIPYGIEVIAEGLDVPWEMDISPDGRIFFTERSGRVRVIQQGKLLDEPLIQIDEPFISKSEGGLLGLVLDPHFLDNGYLYVYHTYEKEGEIKNRVLRLIEENNKAKIDTVLIDHLPGAANHNGGRIKIGPDGYLYITSGDRYEPALAQDQNSLGGKILRIALDGSIPDTNPFPDSPVYSWGHRNVQGLAWHPKTKKLYSSEHGQSAHDEINLIEPGANYGWPEVIGGQQSDGMTPPIIHSGVDTWAPSGMTFVTQGPWSGELLVAALRGEKIIKFTLEGEKRDQVSNVEFIFEKEWGRIRNVYEAPDGSLYFMTNNQDGRGNSVEGDDKLIRLKRDDHSKQ